MVGIAHVPQSPNSFPSDAVFRFHSFSLVAYIVFGCLCSVLWCMVVRQPTTNVRPYLITTEATKMRCLASRVSRLPDSCTCMRASISSRPCLLGWHRINTKLEQILTPRSRCYSVHFRHLFIFSIRALPSASRRSLSRPHFMFNRSQRIYAQHTHPPYRLPSTVAPRQENELKRN